MRLIISTFTLVIYPMFLLLLFITFLLPSHHSSAYAMIDLNALSADSSTVLEVEAEENMEVEEVKEVGKIDKVEVRHKQKGLLLALLPISFTIRVVVLPDGSVELFYPWYSAITVDRREEIKTKIEVAVDNALKARLVGSVQAEGKPLHPKFSQEEADTVRKAVEEALSQSLTSVE